MRRAICTGYSVYVDDDARTSDFFLASGGSEGINCN